SGLHVFPLPSAGALRAASSAAYLDVRIPCLVFEAVAAAGMGGILIFNIGLPLARVRVPRILQDVVVAGASLVASLSLASRNGINLSGLIATSAVLTAVIGFSLQDWFGNIMGGLALQLDNSIEVGDWIKVNDVVGKVAELRWRYTAIETRNWET